MHNSQKYSLTIVKEKNKKIIKEKNKKKPPKDGELTLQTVGIESLPLFEWDRGELLNSKDRDFLLKNHKQTKGENG